MYAEPGRRIIQFLSVGFDGSMIEIFSALCYGTTLVLRPDNDDALAALQDVDIAVITPSAVEALDPSDFPNLKYVCFVSTPLDRVCAVILKRRSAVLRW
jgi:gliotoxin/aspirochlorine biosynthesis peptide synthetase